MERKRKIQVLFICTGNSARSQMSEGLFRKVAGNIAEVYSGGTNPAQEVNPFAKRVLSENGIDPSNHYPKSLDGYLKKEFDIIVTTCDNARQRCPVFPGKARRYHWDLEDPAEIKGSDSEKLEGFRQIFAKISQNASELLKVVEEMYNNPDSLIDKDTKIPELKI